MPKLFIANLEETAPADDIDYSRVYVPEIKRVCSRFIHYLDENDVIALPKAIQKEFLGYYADVYGYQTPVGTLIPPAESSPYTLIDSLIEDRETIESLRRWNREADWVLDACIYTPKLRALSQLLEMPVVNFGAHVLPGELVLELNCKCCFKRFLRDRGFPVIPGYIASDLNELVHYIDVVSRKNDNKIMLKKPLYGGGLGNISGTREALLPILDQWYQGGDILVEFFMDVDIVSGTLVKLHESIEYIGSNIQFFDGGNWVGFSYPLKAPDLAGRLQKLSLDIAEEFHQKGVRGDLNLDWAITRDGKIHALECNLRYNGFGVILDCGKKYFKTYDKSVLYQGHFQVTGDTKVFLKEIDPLVIKTPGEKEGIILVTPPHQNVLSLAIFADDEERVKRIYTQIKTVAQSCGPRSRPLCTA